jgi:hypothetical protein
MTFGIVFDVSAPIEFYDAVHAAVRRRTGDAADGLLVHVGRATDRGFEVLEIWQSREQYERFTTEVLGPVLAELPGQPDQQPDVVEFEPRGLTVPAARVLA